MRSCQAHPFWKFGWRFNPPIAERGGGIHYALSFDYTWKTLFWAHFGTFFAQEINCINFKSSCTYFILDPFSPLPQKAQTRSFLEKILASAFSLTFCKKSECFTKLEKSHFGPMLPLKPDKLKTRFSSPKSFGSSSRFYFDVTSCKKYEKSYSLIFHEIWKTSFWDLWRPVWPKRPGRYLFESVS